MSKARYKLTRSCIIFQLFVINGVWSYTWQSLRAIATIRATISLNIILTFDRLNLIGSLLIIVTFLLPQQIIFLQNLFLNCWNLHVRVFYLFDGWIWISQDLIDSKHSVRPSPHSLARGSSVTYRGLFAEAVIFVVGVEIRIMGKCFVIRLANV